MQPAANSVNDSMSISHCTTGIEMRDKVKEEKYDEEAFDL